MVLINEKDETLMSICGETQWWVEMGPESGGPNENCALERLCQSGYTSASLTSADERDVPSLELLYRLVFPEKRTRTH